MLYEEKFTIAGARKRLQTQKARDKKQLNFDFATAQNHQKILKEIKEELKILRKILG